LKDLTEGPTPQYLRVGVKQKGCSGNSYDLQFTESKGKFDEIVNQDGKHMQTKLTKQIY
jgi:Fe-S cluster assembly iron-binding protein IscA